MKKIFFLAVCAVCLITSACGDTGVGIIGGADGPTSIFVTDKLGTQYEKRTIRMFNAGGELYFDSGEVSMLDARCGTLDGMLKKSVDEGKIPKNPGEANFDAAGYQTGNGNTKEVCIGDEWVVFYKFDGLSDDIENYDYCFYVRGRLNDAQSDSEWVVLTDNKDITFSEIYEPLLSSQYDENANTSKVALDDFTADDKWGIIHMTAEDVTPTGCTLKIVKQGGDVNSELGTGDEYSIERYTDGSWCEVNTDSLADYAWHETLHIIKNDATTKLKVEWEWLYGELSAGEYRIKKEIINATENDNTKKSYYAYFTIQ